MGDWLPPQHCEIAGPLPAAWLQPAHAPCRPIARSLCLLQTLCLQLVFALVSVGAIILTVNVVLLGGTIGFFQSLCLLGYCLFPLDVAAIVCVTTDILLVRWGLAGGCWAAAHCWQRSCLMPAEV